MNKAKIKSFWDLIPCELGKDTNQLSMRVDQALYGKSFSGKKETAKTLLKGKRQKD